MDHKRRVLEAGLGEVVSVVGEEEEPAEVGAVDDDPRRHGRPAGPSRRGGGRRRGPPRVCVRVVRGAEAAGPCTHLTLTRRERILCGSDTHSTRSWRTITDGERSIE
uniref:Uncharacterized protein n=1 Tax=Setaria italica TaxID=4555 RepID=K3YB17_SETIT